MSDCARILDLLDDFRKGRLAEAERNAVAEHTTACAACAEELAACEQLAGLLRGAGEASPPDGYLEQTRRRVVEQVASPAAQDAPRILPVARPARRTRYWLEMAAAFILGAGIVTLAWVAGDDTPLGRAGHLAMTRDGQPPPSGLAWTFRDYTSSGENEEWFRATPKEGTEKKAGRDSAKGKERTEVSLYSNTIFTAPPVPADLPAPEAASAPQASLERRIDTDVDTTPEEKPEHDIAAATAAPSVPRPAARERVLRSKAAFAREGTPLASEAAPVPASPPALPAAPADDGLLRSADARVSQRALANLPLGGVQSQSAPAAAAPVVLADAAAKPETEPAAAAGSALRTEPDRAPVVQEAQWYSTRTDAESTRTARAGDKVPTLEPDMIKTLYGPLSLEYPDAAENARAFQDLTAPNKGAERAVRMLLDAENAAAAGYKRQPARTMEYIAETWPGSPIALRATVRLGELRERMGETEAAVEAYRKCLEPPLAEHANDHLLHIELARRIDRLTTPQE